MLTMMMRVYIQLREFHIIAWHVLLLCFFYLMESLLLLLFFPLINQLLIINIPLNNVIKRSFCILNQPIININSIDLLRKEPHSNLHSKKPLITAYLQHILVNKLVRIDKLQSIIIIPILESSLLPQRVITQMPNMQRRILL